MLCNNQKKIFNCNHYELYIDQKLIDAGIFDFKIINCIDIFFDQNIEYLPENFYIPENIINYDHMFYHCDKLKKLPKNFKINNSVADCNYMFSHCVSLQQLPQNFEIPIHLNHFYQMFAYTSHLVKIPEKLYQSLKAKKLSDTYIIKNIFPYSAIEEIGQLQ